MNLNWFYPDCGRDTVTHLLPFSYASLGSCTCSLAFVSTSSVEMYVSVREDHLLLIFLAFLSFCATGCLSCIYSKEITLIGSVSRIPADALRQNSSTIFHGDMNIGCYYKQRPHQVIVLIISPLVVCSCNKELQILLSMNLVGYYILCVSLEKIQPIQGCTACLLIQLKKLTLY